MITSSLSARRQLIAERPDLAEIAQQDFYFSRQNEQAPDEGLFYAQSLFDEADGRVFIKWNRNRVQSAQKIEGVPKLTPAQIETGAMLDEILQRPEFMFTMYLEPGDLQIFKGRYSLHRVTPLSGPIMRYVAIFSFTEMEGIVGSPERTKQLYGRVLPIHLERAGMRGDALVD